MPRLVFRPANEDVPLLHAPSEEDAPPHKVPALPWALNAPIQLSNEDAGALGLAFDEEGLPPVVLLPWALRRPLAVPDDDLPVSAAALVFEEDSFLARPMSQGTLAILRPFPVDDDLPVTAATLAAEDEAGPLPRALGWPPPLPRPPLEDDAPLLYGPLEEDFFAFPKPIPLVALQQPRPPDTEDVPALHGPFEEDRWTSGVAPVQAFLWQKLPYLPDADGDGFTPSPTHVPKIANLALAQQNLAALALADAAKRNLGIAPSGQRALSLAQSGPSRLSLSSLAERFLSLIRDD